MPHQVLMLGLGAAFATLLGGAVVTSQANPPPATTASARSVALARTAPALACEIRKIRTGSMLTLEAGIRAERKLTGDYRFTVTSRSGGGASRSAQNGTFELDAKRPAVLGEIGLDAGADYEAKLTLTLPDDKIVCEARS